MNDPGAPPLNWDEIFDRAHRRLFSRLILLAAVGALGALLLLGGGLSARGAVRWRIGPLGNAKVAKPVSKVSVAPKVAEVWRPSSSSNHGRPQPTAHGNEAARASRDQEGLASPEVIVTPGAVGPPACPNGSGSADKQYSDCPPKVETPETKIDANSAEGSENGEGGNPEGIEGNAPTATDQSGLADATPEGVDADDPRLPR